MQILGQQMDFTMCRPRIEPLAEQLMGTMRHRRVWLHFRWREQPFKAFIPTQFVVHGQ